MALVFFACWIVWALQEVGRARHRHGAVRAEGRDDRRAEAADGRRVLRGRLPGDRLDPLPAGLAQLSALRQRLRRREHARNHGHDGAGPRLAAADSVLFHGAAGRAGAGDGLHAADRRLHAADLSAPRGAADGTDARPRRNAVASRQSGTRRKDKDDDRKLARRPGGAGRGHRGGTDRQGASTAVGRNPGASTKIMVQSILAIAFAEAIVFYALFLVASAADAERRSVPDHDDDHHVA